MTQPTAHIYNASQPLEIGKLRWPALDRLIELHKTALLTGDVPTTPAAMLTSFSHQNFGAVAGMTYKKKIKRLNRTVTLMRMPVTTQSFNEYWDTAGRIPYTYALDSNALAAAAENTPSHRC